MNKQLHVVAVFNARPECIEEVIEILRTLASPSRAEPGCIEYGFVQDTTDAAVILSMEEWRDRRAFEKHLASAHFKSAFEQLPPLLQSEPDIHTCRTIV